MPQPDLDSFEILAGFQMVGGQAMTQHMRPDSLAQSCLLVSITKVIPHPLYHGNVFACANFSQALFPFRVSALL